MDDEILDVVDGFDEVIGTVNRKDYDTWVNQKQGYIRAAELFIVNDKDEVWVPVRTADKRIAPNGYDFSAAGHVESGDDYLKTMIRETEEELNIKLHHDQLEFIATIKIADDRYITNIYLHRSNETPQFNPHDFVSAEWMTPQAAIENIDAGHPAKGSLRGKLNVLQVFLTESSR
jgi:isopentenyldiphosphate isomerase